MVKLVKPLYFQTCKNHTYMRLHKPLTHARKDTLSTHCNTKPNYTIVVDHIPTNVNMWGHLCITLLMLWCHLHVKYTVPDSTENNPIF